MAHCCLADRLASWRGLHRVGSMIPSKSPGPPSWARTLSLIAAFSIAALALAWVVVPVIAAVLSQLLFGATTGTPPEFLALDLALSFLAFLAACYGAAALSRGHPVATATGVA